MTNPTLSRLVLSKSVNPKVLAALGLLGVALGLWFLIDGQKVFGAFCLLAGVIWAAMGLKSFGERSIGPSD